jgi:hypothetical protein
VTGKTLLIISQKCPAGGRRAALGGFLNFLYIIPVLLGQKHGSKNILFNPVILLKKRKRKI